MLRKLILSTALIGGFAMPCAAADEAEITLIINQSPWYAGFEATVEDYEAKTGNSVNIEAVPFPALLEKSRNSVRANEGIYDLFAINAIGIMEMYSGGFLEPVNNIDPDYKLHDDISDFGGSLYWNAETQTLGRQNGELMALPMAGVIQLLYYRRDLYEENGLDVPETWDHLLENARKLHNPPEIYGYTVRGSRQNIGYNAMGYIASHGGGVFADPASGDYTVTINSPEALNGFKTFLTFADELSPENPGAIGQSEMIQLLATGKVAHAVAVNAAWAGLENPNKSIVAGKMGAALLPRSGEGDHASSTGHFIGGIPRNIPDERKKAALAFMKWLNTPEGQKRMVENGSVPVSKTLTAGDFDDADKYRFLDAVSANAAHALFYAPVKERDEVNSIIDLYFNKAVIGEATAEEALDTAADEIHKIMVRGGYNSGVLPPLASR
jgi:multiple sugar transport system substrate-binding protein